MSYCRWSSDDWTCELYCYEDVSGGWTTHVAGNRVVGEIPKAPFSMLKDDPDGWLVANRKQMDFLETAKREDIGLPYDGQSFNDPTLEDFLERLLHLKKVGYRFPDYVLEEVRAEIKGDRS